MPVIIFSHYESLNETKSKVEIDKPVHFEGLSETGGDLYVCVDVSGLIAPGR